MPLIRIDAVVGRTSEEIRRSSIAAHRAVLSALDGIGAGSLPDLP